LYSTRIALNLQREPSEHHPEVPCMHAHHTLLCSVASPALAINSPFSYSIDVREGHLSGTKQKGKVPNHRGDYPPRQGIP
jgi:hypothetical protein